MSRTGIYPGTFDPITDGHIDIIKRALNVVDHLIIAVAKNAGKNPLFTLEERTSLIGDLQEDLGAPDRISIKSFDHLLIDFAKEEGADVLIRGLRAVSDFEYEFQMAGMNRKLAPDIETVFLMASDRHQLISSRFVKEIAALGGDVSHFAPKGVVAALKARLKK